MRFRWPVFNQGDPWRRRPDPQGEPPNLDELFKRLLSIVKAKQSKGGPNIPHLSLPWLKLIPLLLFMVWLLSGLFVVNQAERAVILRFGRYVETLGPGLHWIPPLIERHMTQNVEQVAQFSYQALMLTKDENIVSVEVSIQYRIANLHDYLFNVRKPVLSINEATASALRFVVGHTPLDDLLTTGREAVRDEVMKQLQAIMKLYGTGLLVTKVSLQPAKPPEEVTAAFNDAIKAREDEQRFINQANAYASKVLPIAEGQAARLTQSAEADSKQFVLLAQGRTALFMALLPEYRRHPEVMRDRMYIQAIENVLSRSSKILVDVKGNPVFYLPLDRIMGRGIHRLPANAVPMNQVNLGDASSQAHVSQEGHDPYGARDQYGKVSGCRHGHE